LSVLLCRGAGRRLFQRVVLLGGSALSPWSVPRDSVAQSAALAARLNCSSAGAGAAGAQLGGRTAALVVQCLRRVDVDRLVAASHAGRPTSAAGDDAWSAAAAAAGFGPTLGRAGAGVLPGSSVDQLIHDACDNRCAQSVRADISLFFPTTNSVPSRPVPSSYLLSPSSPHDTIRDAILTYFNVRSKANISQLNLPHGTDN